MKLDPDYPRMMFHRTKGSVTIYSRDEEHALGREWSRTIPQDPAPEPEPELFRRVPAAEPDPDPPPEPEPEPEKEVPEVHPRHTPKPPPIRSHASKTAKKKH